MSIPDLQKALREFPRTSNRNEGIWTALISGLGIAFACGLAAWKGL